MIKRFNDIQGRYIEKIIGQDRFAYALSDITDFYDMIELSKKGRYQGSTVTFFDFYSGNVYKPFEKKRNVIYSKPVYSDGVYYFLQGDYNKNKIALYRYLPEVFLEKEIELDDESVNLYNLCIIGKSVHIISQDDKFECYYPKKISFPIDENESAMFIEDDKIYFEAWIEEGWDTENDCATADYKYYNKIIVKDFYGNKIAEELGTLYQAEDGTWWIG